MDTHAALPRILTMPTTVFYYIYHMTKRRDVKREKVDSCVQEGLQLQVPNWGWWCNIVGLFDCTNICMKWPQTRKYCGKQAEKCGGWVVNVPCKIQWKITKTAQKIQAIAEDMKTYSEWDSPRVALSKSDGKCTILCVAISLFQRFEHRHCCGFVQ